MVWRTLAGDAGRGGRAEDGKGRAERRRRGIQGERGRRRNPQGGQLNGLVSGDGAPARDHGFHGPHGGGAG